MPNTQPTSGLGTLGSPNKEVWTSHQNSEVLDTLWLRCGKANFTALSKRVLVSDKVADFCLHALELASFQRAGLQGGPKTKAKHRSEELRLLMALVY